MAQYRVSKLKDIVNVIIPHFNKYPLQSAKLIDFNLSLFLAVIFYFAYWEFGVKFATSSSSKIKSEFIKLAGNKTI